MAAPQPRYARIAPIQPQPDLDTDELVRVLNDRITELNIVFTELETAEQITRGSGGQTTIYDSDLDISDQRLTNVKRSRDPKDTVTRRELTELGLFPDSTGKIRISREVEFLDRVSSSAPTSNDGGSFPSNDDVINLINAAIGDNVATSRDGQAVTVENAAGDNGVTEGTLAMARDPQTGKARMLKVVGDNLQVDSPQIASLLILLIQEVKELKIELSNRG